MKIQTTIVAVFLPLKGVCSLSITQPVNGRKTNAASLPRLTIVVVVVVVVVSVCLKIKNNMRLQAIL